MPCLIVLVIKVYVLWKCTLKESYVGLITFDTSDDVLGATVCITCFAVMLHNGSMIIIYYNF